MLSPRRTAQFGLGCVGLVLISSLSILVARTVDPSATMSIDVGDQVPSFELPDARGNQVSFASFRGKTVVLFFTSSGCPVSARYAGRAMKMVRQYAKDPRVQFVAIYSAAEEQPTMEARVEAKLLPYPTLIDTRALVARRFGARVTPTFYVIDPEGLVCYRGRFDDNEDARKVRVEYVRDAVQDLLEGQPVAKNSTQAFGRSIEWPK